MGLVWFLAGAAVGGFAGAAGTRIRLLWLLAHGAAIEDVL